MASHQCPVCSKYFTTGEINTHVNLCLNSVNDRKDQAHTEGRELSYEEPKAKRLKTDVVVSSHANPKTSGQNWNFMMKTKSITSPVRSGGNISREKLPTQNDLEMTKANMPEKPANGSNKCETPKAQETGSPSGIHSNVPLAERMRPLTMSDYIGQEQAVGHNKLLRTLFETNRIPSMILWGPPGCGKVNVNTLSLSLKIIMLIERSGLTCGFFSDDVG